MNTPNKTFRQDSRVATCSFMVESDAHEFLEELGRLGLNIDSPANPDAIIVSPLDQETRPLQAWFHIGPYLKSTIGWMDGEQVKTVVGPPGWDPNHESLQYCTKQEAAERLEFLRNENGVEVYLDRRTGKEVYTGRTKLPLEDMFAEAGRIVTSRMINPGQPPLIGAAADEVFRAVELLEITAEREPGHWRVFWMLGKAEHALGKLDQSLAAFRKALTLAPGETAILRELAGICLEIGLGAEAVDAAEKAVANDPSCHQLLGNLAMAHLIAGNPRAAASTIDAACRRNPNDPVNQSIRRIIGEVSGGTRRPPAKLGDLTNSPQREPEPQHRGLGKGGEQSWLARLREVFAEWSPRGK